MNRMLLVGKPNKEPQQTFCDVQQLNYNHMVLLKRQFQSK